MNFINIPSNQKNSLVIWSPYLFLILVCILNLSWNITDHDDGHTLGFHNMGRNPYIQRSYGAYDSMCDYLLGFLTIDYKLLLGFMVGSTILASFLILYFSAILLKLWFRFNAFEVALAQLLFLIAMPEFIYMVFSFKSVYIALAIILASANILFKKPESYQMLLFSAVVFGLAVSFRWNMLMMGIPFTAMLLLDLKRNCSWKNTIFKILTWGTVSITSSLLFIFISGYSPIQIIEIYTWGKEYIEKANFDILSVIGNYSLFITPVTLLLFYLSTLYFRNNKSDLLKLTLLFFCSYISIALISRIPFFKLMAPLWITFIAVFAFACRFIIQSSFRNQRVLILVLLLSIFVNWFLGLQLLTQSSNWGPGLDVKTNVESLDVFDNNLKTDGRFKLENFKVGFFDGFGLPTSEGMRPLYGHFYALFLGKLNRLDEKLNRETDTIIAKASRNNQYIYQDRINPYLLASYCRLEYRTSDLWLQKGKDFSKRKFTDGLNYFTEFRINNPNKLFDIPLFRKQFTRNDTVFLSFTYTSSLNKFLYNLNLTDDISFKKIGPMSAKVWFKN